MNERTVRILSISYVAIYILGYVLPTLSAVICLLILTYAIMTAHKVRVNLELWTGWKDFVVTWIGAHSVCRLLPTPDPGYFPLSWVTLMILSVFILLIYAQILLYVRKRLR